MDIIEKFKLYNLLLDEGLDSKAAHDRVEEFLKNIKIEKTLSYEDVDFNSEDLVIVGKNDLLKRNQKNTDFTDFPDYSGDSKAPSNKKEE